MKQDYEPSMLESPIPGVKSVNPITTPFQSPSISTTTTILLYYSGAILVVQNNFKFEEVLDIAFLSPATKGKAWAWFMKGAIFQVQS